VVAVYLITPPLSQLESASPTSRCDISPSNGFAMRGEKSFGY
jgi:hypothetical protein